MVPEFHSEDNKLLLEVVTKHVSWHSEKSFEENALELRAYISKVLRKPKVSINTEPHWVLPN